MASEHEGSNLPVTASEPCSFEVTLVNEKVWKQLKDIVNEMMINKPGTFICPRVETKLKNLNPDASYVVTMDFVRLDTKYYIHHKDSGWNSVRLDDERPVSAVYIHPRSPTLGKIWMKDPVNFNPRLTNNIPEHDQKSMIVLSSGFKYMARIHIIQSDNLDQFSSGFHHTFHMPITTFTTVTQYKNSEIRELKRNIKNEHLSNYNESETQTLGGYACSSCTEVKDLLPEHCVPSDYTSQNASSEVNRQVPSSLPHSSDTPSTSSLNQISESDNFVLSPDVHHQPAFSHPLQSMEDIIDAVASGRIPPYLDHSSAQDDENQSEHDSITDDENSLQMF